MAMHVICIPRLASLNPILVSIIPTSNYMLLINPSHEWNQVGMKLALLTSHDDSHAGNPVCVAGTRIASVLSRMAESCVEHSEESRGGYLYPWGTGVREDSSIVVPSEGGTLGIRGGAVESKGVTDFQGCGWGDELHCRRICAWRVFEGGGREGGEETERRGGRK